MGSSKRVKVEVMHNGCIAVDNLRITNRSTKWGIMRTIDRFNVNRENVVKHLKKRGHSHLLSKIDTKEFMDMVEKESSDES